eukprot:CAMPEP_0118944758 /NCGR_PEP_ID=MMETSP1169-20130426/40945_1 /TAXON_ID=36882 /ORGANISM="Pyramimonas obovata, Strain CCMP722" /LENGTH=219 /DNA_ID=CAMNT_0006890317 /DNA_START=395 /DNA_END=1054 /DNA_ORIENTATION=-
MANQLETVEELPTAEEVPVTTEVSLLSLGQPNRGTPKRPPLAPSAIAIHATKAKGSPILSHPSKPPIGRLLQMSSRTPTGSPKTEGASSSEVLTRVGGIINSRSSVHRPPNSARASTGGATGQALQHDLDLLNVYKQLRREETRTLAMYASPYRFVDDGAVEDASGKVREGNPEAWGMNLEGYARWTQQMEEAMELRSRRAKVVSPREPRALQANRGAS